MRLAALILISCTLSGSAGAGRMTPGRGAGDAPPRRAETPAPAWRRPESREASPPEPLAIVGAEIHPVTRPVVPSGTLLLRDGRIEAVLGESARIPRGYRVIDGHGLQAWPGFVAAGADGLGLAEDAWAGGPDAMLARGVGESFDPWSDQVELAASAGITTALVWRASEDAKSPLAGRAALLKMSVRRPEGAVLREIGGALAGRGILTPAGRRAARQAIDDARSRKPATDDPRAELWRGLARKEAPLVATFDAAGDVISVAELARELDVNLVLHTPAEAWPVADKLAEPRYGVVQNVRTTWGKPREDRRSDLPGGLRFDAIRRLRDAGVSVAVGTDSATISPWGVAGRDLLDLPLEAAFAVRAGLSEREAIEAITIGAARMLQADDRIGSLEAGKDADVVLLDGDPLDYRTFVRTTIVNGRVVHQAERSRFWRLIVEERDRALRDRSDRP